MSYADEFPEHSRTSCSDQDPCNADPEGHGCWRCNALLFDRLEATQSQYAGCQIGLAEAHKRAEKWKAIAINLHDHRDFVRNLDRAGLEEAIRATERFSPRLAALYAAMLQEHP